MQTLRARDPIVLEISRHADLFQRPDWGPEASTALDKRNGVLLPLALEDNSPHSEKSEEGSMTGV